MLITHNRKFLGRLSLLIAVIALSGVIVVGCYGVATPVGWSGATIDEDTLFFGTSEGKLIALDASSGDRLRDWGILPETSAPAAGGIMGCMGAPAAPVAAIYGTPVVAEDLVYVGGYIKEGNQTRGRFYAFSSGEDEPRWVYPREGYFSGPVVGGAVVALEMVYFGCSDGKVYALDAANGFKEWEFETGDKIWSTPAIKDGTIFIGSFDKKLYALDATSGNKKWEFEAGGGIACTPLISDNTIYFGSFDRHVYAIDATTGSLLWKTEVEAGSWFWANLLIHNDVIYAGCVDGKVYVLDAENGHELIPAIDLGSLIRSSPVLVDNLVIIATEDGRVYSLDTNDSRLRELASVEGVVYAPLSTSDGVVYVHTHEEDAIYAVSVDSGTKRKLY